MKQQRKCRGGREVRVVKQESYRIINKGGNSVGVITVNPDAQPLGDFPVVKAGEYDLEIVEATDTDDTGAPLVSQKSGNPMIACRLRFTDPFVELEDEAGNPLTQEPGQIFHNVVTAPPEKQGMLRSLVEGALGEWRDFDPTELVGQTIKVRLKVTSYQGNKRNEIGKVFEKSGSSV